MYSTARLNRDIKQVGYTYSCFLFCLTHLIICQSVQKLDELDQLRLSRCMINWRRSGHHLQYKLSSRAFARIIKLLYVPSSIFGSGDWPQGAMSAFAFESASKAADRAAEALV